MAYFYLCNTGQAECFIPGVGRIQNVCCSVCATHYVNVRHSTSCLDTIY